MHNYDSVLGQSLLQFKTRILKWYQFISTPICINSCNYMLRIELLSLCSRYLIYHDCLSEEMCCSSPVTSLLLCYFNLRLCRLVSISFSSPCTTWRLTSWPLHCQGAARRRVTRRAGEEWRKMASDVLRKSVHSFLFTPTLLILITPLVFSTCQHDRGKSCSFQRWVNHSKSFDKTSMNSHYKNQILGFQITL